MSDNKAHWFRHGRFAMMSACIRLLGSLLGGIIGLDVLIVVLV